jgi:hypothetical protein
MCCKHRGLGETRTRVYPDSISTEVILAPGGETRFTEASPRYSSMKTLVTQLLRICVGMPSLCILYVDVSPPDAIVDD